MGSDFLIFIGFGVVLILIFLIVVFKDMQANKKFARYEKVLEGVIQENHNLKKQIQNLSASSDAEFDADYIESKLELKLNEQINSKIIPILNALRGIENSIDNFHSEQQDRLYTLEERTKNIGKITSASESNDEKRIIELYGEGKSIENIAKDLRIGVGKVELALKLYKIT